MQIEKEIKEIKEILININTFPRWLDVKLACQYTSMSKNTLMSHIMDNNIYAKKINGKWYVDRESVDKFMLTDNINIHMEQLRILKK